MLSIGQASGGYFASLAEEDYYHSGGEPPGVWAGEGAREFGLTGQVDLEQFLNLCDGYFENVALVQNAGKENHRSGWDLTFSAPKSVSVLWSQADPELRREIQEAHFEAIKKVLAYLEREAAYTRRGKAGAELEQCKLIIATFEHGTSRAQDPQLHTHAVVLNVGIREDGTIGTLESKPLYRHKMTAGALYRAELAAELQSRLSVLLYRTKDAFEIKGVSKEIIGEFSKRREAIEAAMKEAGARGAARAAYFTVTTREKKKHIARELLFETWQATGREKNFSLEGIISKEISSQDIERGKLIAAEKGAEAVTQSQAYFTEKDLIRRVAEEAIEQGLNSSEVLSAVKEYTEKEAIHLGRRGGELYYTTREIDALEKQMLSQVEASKRLTHEVNLDAISLPSTLNDEQKAALLHITSEAGAIKVVSGLAGTGKTTLLKEARKIWEAAGYEVRGAALAAVAAKGLEEGAGIKSQTIARLLLETGRIEATEKKGKGTNEAKQRVEIKTPEQKKQERQAMIRRIFAEYKYATHQWRKETKEKYLGEYFKPTNERYHEFLYATWQISKKHRDYLDLQIRIKERATNDQNQRQSSPLNDRTILVVDEAGMVGTRQMSYLIDEAAKTGAKLVFVGDEKQLQPIEHGAPFKAIGERLGKAELQDIKRQRDEWAREAVKDFAKGDARKGLESYAERGLLTVTETRREAIEKLVSDWSREGVKKPEENLIIASTRAEAKRLNTLSQEERRQGGELRDAEIKINGQTFFENDRVLFTLNKKRLGVNNGDCGTIERISNPTSFISVKLDSGERVSIPTHSYQAIELGYAITTHKGQGKTVENAFVLAGGSMQDRELSYVQMSRTRNETRIYTERAEVGDTITELSKVMSHSRQKELAQDIRTLEQTREQERTLSR